MSDTAVEPAASANKEIFPNRELSDQALRWKELNRTGRHKEAMDVLEEIVVGSTEMFERLAQHERFHLAVELPVLVSAAQEKVIRWLLAWQPKKGTLFSWFSKCAKNAFRSEVVKVLHYRKRYHVTGDNLEKFFGSDDHEVNKHDALAEIHAKLKNLTCRWGDPQEIGAIKYLIECVISDETHDKQAAIEGAACCWGISPDFARFFYTWVLINLRNELYEQTYIPFTEQDLFRQAFSHNYIVDLADIVGYENVKKVIAVMGGVRIKFPTLVQIARIKEDYDTFREIDLGDKDPAAIAAVARRRNKSAKSAELLYEEQCKVLHPKRSGEYALFGTDEESPEGI